MLNNFKKSPISIYSFLRINFLRTNIFRANGEKFSLKRALISLFLTLSFVSLSACNKTKSKNERTEQRLEDVYTYIDRGEYDSAINLAEEMSQRPMNSAHEVKIRTAWASALAARAGIRVGEIWGFVEAFSLSDDYSTQMSTSSTIGQVPNAQQILDTMLMIESIRKKLNLIPRLDIAQTQDLNKSLEVIAPVVSLSRGAALYSSALRVVQLKNVVDDELRVNLVSFENGKCTLHVEKLKSSGDRIFATTREVLHTTALAYPSKQSEVNGYIVKLDSIQSSYNQFVDNVDWGMLVDIGRYLIGENAFWECLK